MSSHQTVGLECRAGQDEYSQKKLKDMKEDNIHRVRCTKDIILSIATVAIGIILCLLGSTGAGILGAIVVASGLFMLFTLKTAYKIDGQEGLFKRKSYDLPTSKKEAAMSFLQGKSQTLDKGNGSGLILYLYHDSSMQKGFAQLYEYAQYEYNLCTELVQLNPQQIASLVG